MKRRMQALKTRLSELLGWWAFLHAGLILDLTILWALGITPSTFAWFGAFVDAYSAFFLMNGVLFLSFAPAVWVTLRLATGRSRILPWRE
jgi:hypothetical protein